MVPGGTDSVQAPSVIWHASASIQRRTWVHVANLAQYGWSERYNAEISGGRNSRTDEMQATVLRVKLPHLDGWDNRRRSVAELYQSGLRDVHGIGFEARGAEDDTVHLFVVECEDRSTVLANLREGAVGCGAVTND